MGGVVQSTWTAFSSLVMPSLAKAVGTASIGSLTGLVVNKEALPHLDVSQLAPSKHLSVPEHASGCPTLEPDLANQPLEAALAAAISGLDFDKSVQH